MVDEENELNGILRLLNDDTNLRKSQRIRIAKLEQAKRLLTTIKNNYQNNIKFYTIDVWQRSIEIFRLIKQSIIMPLDIKEATSIVQTYDGSADALEAFIDSANLLDELTDAANKTTAIKFLRTRLTGKARLGLANNYNSIANLINDVKQRCEVKTSPEALMAKLNAIKEKDCDKLCEEVDSLTNKLSSLYMADNIPPDVALKMATKAGVDALTKKINNHDTKIILKAGSFSTIQQAIQKVRENTTTDAQPQILSYRTNNRGRRNGPPQQQRFGSQQQQRYHFNTGNRGRFQHFYSGNRGRGSCFQYPRQNYNNYQAQGQNFHPRNVYYAEVGNNQSPQQGGVGGMAQTQIHPTTVPNQNVQLMHQPGQVSIAQFQRR